MEIQKTKYKKGDIILIRCDGYYMPILIKDVYCSTADKYCYEYITHDTIYTIECNSIDIIGYIGNADDMIKIFEKGRDERIESQLREALSILNNRKSPINSSEKSKISRNLYQALFEIRN